jgi:hypothetical protein
VPDAEVPSWFTGVDLALFLYPRPFSSSGALALALGYGTPFLVSRELGACAGVPERLWVDRDPAKLADRLRGLHHSDDEFATMRATAAQLGSERSWPHIAHRHLRVYEEVSRARRSARRGFRPS